MTLIDDKILSHSRLPWSLNSLVTLIYALVIDLHVYTVNLQAAKLEQHTE